MSSPTWSHGEIVRVARNLYVRREGESHGWLDHAIACQISGGVLRGPTVGVIHGLTDDIPHAIHVLVPEGRRIKPRTAGPVIRSRDTCQTRNLEIGVEEIPVNGFHLRVTDKARTVVDRVRCGDIRQHAVEAVRAWLADRCNAGRLRAMADQSGVASRGR